MIKYKLEKFKGEEIIFKDFNFKLSVIQILMYELAVLTPMFDLYQFVSQYKKREIDIEEEGYEFIPEVTQFFKDLKIDKKFAHLITEIHQGGGNRIYSQILRFWDGEDDIFNFQSVDDAKHFTNLEYVTLFYEIEGSIIKNKFIELGIDAEYI